MEKLDEIFAYFGPVGGWVVIILSFVFTTLADLLPWFLTLSLVINLYEKKWKSSLIEKEAL